MITLSTSGKRSKELRSEAESMFGNKESSDAVVSFGDTIVEAAEWWKGISHTHSARSRRTELRRMADNALSQTPKYQEPRWRRSVLRAFLLDVTGEFKHFSPPNQKREQSGVVEVLCVPATFGIDVRWNFHLRYKKRPQG